jgi:hypothetical protein
MLREAADQLLRIGHPEGLSWICSHDSAPENLLLELCDRGMFLDELGHRKGPRRLLERLAEKHCYPEAIITLAVDLYTDANESPESLADFLGHHAECGWMLEMLAVLDPAPAAKADAFLATARNHPDAERILALAESHRLEREAETSADPLAVERLHATSDPRVWRALASNQWVPRHLLEELAGVTGIRGAAEIRERARRNLAMHKDS